MKLSTTSFLQGVQSDLRPTLISVVPLSAHFYFGRWEFGRIEWAFIDMGIIQNKVKLSSIGPVQGDQAASSKLPVDIDLNVGF